MAQSLQARTAARGFPYFDVSGQSGQGHLPDSTRPGPGYEGGTGPGVPITGYTDPNVDWGSVPAALPLPEEYVVLGQMRWGLPAGTRPDDMPKSATGPHRPEGNTHAAPLADPTLAWQDGARKNSEGIEAYNEELLAAHNPGFNSWEIRHHPGIKGTRNYTHQDTPGSPPGPLQRLDGPIRAMGGGDGVQGYGKFAAGMPEGKKLDQFGTPDNSLRGVNGTNETMPFTVRDKQYPGETFHNVFLNAAEVPLLSPNADQFLPTQPGAPEFGPWPLGGNFDMPTTSNQAQDSVVGDTPATGPAVSASTGLLPLWGSY